MPDTPELTPELLESLKAITAELATAVDAALYRVAVLLGDSSCSTHSNAYIHIHRVAADILAGVPGELQYVTGDSEPEPQRTAWKELTFGSGATRLTLFREATRG